MKKGRKGENTMFSLTVRFLYRVTGQMLIQDVVSCHTVNAKMFGMSSMCGTLTWRTVEPIATWIHKASSGA
jgi:hypothetical protein